ncbi:MAG: hypothetical protein NHG00_00010 [Candidatus Shikimatogenerans sp. JK-2022]|nr:hypothetical protein [Candidatus Shikimatogenerans bostrichidophilus]
MLFNIFNIKKYIKTFKKIFNKKKGFNLYITNNINKISKIDKIILYSNYNINYIINKLKIKNFFLKNINLPILAISTGLNILCKKYKNINCLNIFKNIIVNKLYKKNKNKNKIYHNNDDVIFKNFKKKYFYQNFNNKYYINIGKYTIAHTNYILSYSAILKKNNIYGLQFDPIISGKIGEKIILNFIKYVK